VATRWVDGSWHGCWSATPGKALRQVTVPTLVAVGDQDNDHTSADARFTRVPGTHFTALAGAEFTSTILAFLNDQETDREPTS
jgi:hypothetical protein